MTTSMDARAMAKPADDDAAIASALRTLATEADGISALRDALRDGMAQAFGAAVAAIREARGRVIVTGLGKSGHVGRKIAATLASTGTPASFVHAAEANHGDLGMITADDVVFALSWSGEQAEMRSLVAYATRFGIPVIAMTSDAASALGSAADIALVLPRAREACPHNLAPSTSTLMMLALGDALAIALLEGRGFSSGDFGVLHPGGKLGALLKHVCDLMHVGDAVPVAQAGTAMSEAVLTMSAKGFGCVAIVDVRGALVGIVTDGDLRRHMRPDLLSARVEDVMTRDPKTLRGDLFAGEALEVLNAAKITAAIVTENGRPVGILHLHDLLRAGVV